MAKKYSYYGSWNDIRRSRSAAGQAREMAERIRDNPKLVIYYEDTGEMELNYELTQEANAWAEAEIQRTAGYDPGDQQLHQDLMQRLRSTPLKFTERGDISDFSEYRRSSENYIRFNNESGVPVDSFYSQLADDYPGIFKEWKYSRQSEQVEHINEVYKDTMAGHSRVPMATEDYEAVKTEYTERLKKNLKKELGVSWLKKNAVGNEDDYELYMPFN